MREFRIISVFTNCFSDLYQDIRANERQVWAVVPPTGGGAYWRSQMRTMIAVLATLLTLGGQSFAQEVVRITSTLPDGTKIVYGKWRKAAAGPVDIPFGTAFS